MPMNSVASHTRLTSNEPQWKCIYCNTVPTDKFLTFDKRKYGQNTIVSQMKENDGQNIMCKKVSQCNLQKIPCYMSHMQENYEKMCTLKFDMNKYSSLQNKILEMPKSQRTYSYICKSCHLQLEQKLHVCVATDICINMYVKCPTK